MADEINELKFPIEFTICPNCGSKKKVAETILKKQQEEGKAGQDARAAAMTGQAIIADPRKIHLSLPVLLTFLDICAECGTVYCVRAELGKRAMQAQPPPGKQFPPGMDFGFPQGRPRLS